MGIVSLKVPPIGFDAPCGTPGFGEGMVLHQAGMATRRGGSWRGVVGGEFVACDTIIR